MGYGCRAADHRCAPKGGEPASSLLFATLWPLQRSITYKVVQMYCRGGGVTLSSGHSLSSTITLVAAPSGSDSARTGGELGPCTVDIIVFCSFGGC